MRERLVRGTRCVGKATVTGYCIKFRTLRNIKLDVLEAAIRDGIARSRT